MTLKIGEVATRTGLSTRTLRHYDDLGLLRPVQRSGSEYRLYDESSLQRLLAIQHLKSLGLSLQDIRSALNETDLPANRVLARHIQWVEEQQASYTDLLTRLKRLQATATISWEEVAEVIALHEQLHHPDSNKRTLTALSVKPTGTGAAIPELIHRLSHEADVSVAEHLIWAIVQMGEVALPHLQKQLPNATPETRLQLIHILGKIGNSEAIPGLLPLLDDPDARIVRKVMYVLGKIKRIDALEALALQLGRWGDDLQTATVLSDALQEYGHSALPALHRALKAESVETRVQAAEILGALGLRDSLKPLLAAISDPSPNVQFNALFALRAFNDPAVSIALAGFTEHSVSRIQILARRLLKNQQP